MFMEAAVTYGRPIHQTIENAHYLLHQTCTIGEQTFLISAHKPESMHFLFAFKCTFHAVLMLRFCYTFFFLNNVMANMFPRLVTMIILFT